MKEKPNLLQRQDASFFQRITASYMWPLLEYSKDGGKVEIGHLGELSEDLKTSKQAERLEANIRYYSDKNSDD